MCTQQQQQQKTKIRGYNVNKQKISSWFFSNIVLLGWYQGVGLKNTISNKKISPRTPKRWSTPWTSFLKKAWTRNCFSPSRICFLYHNSEALIIITGLQQLGQWVSFFFFYRQKRFMPNFCCTLLSSTVGATGKFFKQFFKISYLGGNCYIVGSPK